MAAINESAGWARGCSSPRNNSAASRDTSRSRCFLRSCTHLFLVTQLLPNEKRRPKVSYSRAATFQRKCGRFRVPVDELGSIRIIKQLDYHGYTLAEANDLSGY